MCAGVALLVPARGSAPGCDCVAALILTFFFFLVTFDFAWLKLRNTPCQQLIFVSLEKKGAALLWLYFQAIFSF